jgi:hypothetical protein
MTKEDIAAVMGRNPMLHAGGLGRYIGNPRTGTDWDDWLASHRALLLGDIDGCGCTRAEEGKVVLSGYPSRLYDRRPSATTS